MSKIYIYKLYYIRYLINKLSAIHFSYIKTHRYKELIQLFLHLVTGHFFELCFVNHKSVVYFVCNKR